MSNVGSLQATISLGGMDAVERQLKNFSRSMNDVAKKVSDMGNKMKDAGDSISQFGQDLAPISAGLGAVGTAGILASNEIESALNIFKTKLGYTGEELELMQNSMEQVGSTGVGSFNEIAQAMTDVTQNMGELEWTEMEDITEQAIQLAKVMEVDVAEVTRSAGTLMKQFGVDSHGAMDLIAKGYQSNLDFSGEFLDSLNEYSVHFKSLGFSAEDMFNIMITGAEEGAWNLDKVGDAIKEGNIRLKDLSTGSADAFTALGLDAETMFNDFASGGDKAKLAFMTISGALSQVESETERNALGVALFGTQYEDLEKDVVASFGKIEDKLGDYGGTASQLAEDNKTFSQIMQGAWNDLQVAIKPVGDVLKDIITNILPPILSLVKSMGTAFASLPAPIQTVIIAIGGIVAILPILLIGIGTMVSLFGTVMTGAGAIVKGFGLIGTAGTKLISGFRLVGTALRGLMALFMANPFMLIIAGIVVVVALVIKYWDEIVSVTKAVFSALAEWFAPYWDAFKQMVAGVVDFFVGLWESFSETFSSIMSVVIDFALKLWSGFRDGFMAVFNAVVSFLQGAWEIIKTIFLVAIGIILTLIAPIYNAFAEVWNKIVDLVSWVWDLLKKGFEMYVDRVKKNLEIIKNVFTTIWNFIYNNIISPVMEMIKKTIETLVKFVTDVVNKVKDAFQKAWDFIYSNIISPVIEKVKKIIQTVVDKVTAVSNSVKSAFSTAWNYVYSNIISPVINKVKNIIQTVVNKVTSVTNSIKSTFSNAFNSVRDKVSSAVDGVKSKIAGIWTKAKEIADKIKNGFSNIFKSIKIPRFSLGGWTMSDLPKLPKMSIQWNAKGGILDSATMIGAGEKGAEAIVPLSSQRRMSPFAQAIAKFMPEDSTGGGVNVSVAQMVVREEADIRRVSQELYKLIERDRKGGGKR